MSVYHLNNWSVQNLYTDPFSAPESNQRCLVGFRDGETKKIRTSAIIKVNGNEISTISGSVYVLDKIDPEYLQWLLDNGSGYDTHSKW